MKSRGPGKQPTELAKAIRRLRARLHLTGADFGRQYLNCPQSSVADYERGYMKPCIPRLLALLRIAEFPEEAGPIFLALEAGGVNIQDLPAGTSRFVRNLVESTAQSIT